MYIRHNQSERTPPPRVRRRRWFCVRLACVAVVAGLGQSGRGENPPTNSVGPPTLRETAFESTRLPPLISGTSPASGLNSAGYQEMAPERLPPLAADASTPLSLADVEQIALLNNPTLAASRAQVAAARGRQVQAGLYPNPRIGYAADDMGEDGTAGKQGGFVGQEFITWGKLRLSRAVAGQEIQESLFAAEAQQLRVLSDVRLRFYDSLVAQRRVELSAELSKIAAKSADLSRQLLEALQISQSDLLQLEIETEEAQIVLNNARNESTEAWRRLAAVIGDPTIEVRPLAGELARDIPSYEWEATYLKIMANSPELSAAEARVQRARYAIQRARREVVPNVDVMASASHRNQNGDDVAGVQAAIALPIFDRNQGNIMQANAELVAAQNDVRRIELNLQERLAMAYRRYANARQQVDRYQTQIVPRAQQSLDLVSRAYGAGQVNFLVLLTAQRTYIRVNLAYFDSLGELWQGSTLIEGLLLADSLQTEAMSISAEK
jgi:cobalt-zinc-cadmium efflux system outer membrane protein